MNITVPVLCKCGDDTSTCCKCNARLDRCYQHSDSLMCDVCQKIWQCARCDNATLQCYSCKSIMGLCATHARSSYCDRCDKIRRCPLGSHCHIDKCRSCLRYLKTCYSHSLHNGYCDTCAPFKCRIPGCGNLMTYCQSPGCKKIIPVCSNHGAYCEECNINHVHTIKWRSVL